MSYDELLIALEDIIIDKVAIVLTTRNREVDTSAPDGNWNVSER